MFASSPLFDAPTQPSQPPQPHSPWHQTLETSFSGSSLSPVASAAYLLEARLHISQQPRPYPFSSFQPAPAPVASKPVMWTTGSSTDPNMQELTGLTGQQQQQLSSCVMVK